MFPFRNILFPTDFSAHAHAALKYAAGFARDGQGRVLLLNVQDSTVPPNLLTLPGYVFEEQENNWLLELRSRAKELLADPLLDGVEVDPVFVEGDPATEIGRVAFEQEVDLITVATRDRNRLARAFGKSIAEEIVAEAPCPVLAIRPPQRDFVEHRGGKTQIRLNRVLLATNFRPSSAAATQLATSISNHLGAELHAIYVIGDYFEQISAVFPEGGLAALTRLRSHVQERLAQLARSFGPKASTHVAEGRPYQEIVKLAANLDADLIVLGSAVHGSLFGNNQVLGSEIERVIRNAPCPVLCVPAARVVTPLPALVTQAV
ncbi:MAG TPA: universal stress protein [Pyrinomonadaceae bacterium]|nr:universal stress protein [Pyrinomonadaceae bacterium]